MAMWTTIKTVEMQQVFDRVAQLLDNTVMNVPVYDQEGKTVGHRTGWHQKIGEAKVGDVATGQGLLLFKLCKHRNQSLEKFTSTLRDAQYHCNVNDNRYGAWSLLTARDTPTVDATVWPLLGLVAAGEQTNSEVIAAAHNWLINNINEDGGWGPRKGLVSRMYHTFLACFCLHQIDPHFFEDNLPLATKTRDWVIRCRNDDGGWGMTKGEPSSPIHTAYAVYTLFVVNAGKTPEMRSGIDYLYQHWQPRTFWEHTLSSEQYEVPREGERGDAINRPTVDYFVTAKVAYVLLSVGESALRKEIHESITWLIQSQDPEGSWHLRDLIPDRLWAIQDAVLAITEFMARIIAPQSVERVVFVRGFVIGSRQSTIKKLIGIFVGTTVVALLFGMIIGALLCPTTWLGQVIISYWAWIIFAVYIICSAILAMLKVITWKQALTGAIVPTVLAIAQAYLR
jgi:hypothetical protein